jgi:hypothetical protein
MSYSSDPTLAFLSNPQNDSDSAYPNRFAEGWGYENPFLPGQSVAAANGTAAGMLGTMDVMAMSMAIGATTAGGAGGSMGDMLGGLFPGPDVMGGNSEEAIKRSMSSRADVPQASESGPPSYAHPTFVIPQSFLPHAGAGGAAQMYWNDQASFDLDSL